MTFENFVCWKRADAEVFLQTEALVGADHTFLGTHMSFSRFDFVSGNLEGTEEAVFSSLYNERPHVVSLVEGEPGSGKSHLIRWLYYRWPKDESDFVILVPRADGSLLGTLDRLRKELGERYSKPLEGLGNTSSFTAKARARNLLSRLVTTCESGIYEEGEKPRAEHEWLVNGEAWRLLNDEGLREQWSAPADILDTLVGAEGERDQETARFTPAHVVEFARIVNSNAKNIRSSVARLFLADLLHEFQEVQNVIDAGEPVDAQVRALEGTAPNTRRFLRALDARIEDAVTGLLGISRDELKRRLLEVRQLLREDNRRLVLLLEDITNLQGVDQQLIEALLVNAGDPSNKHLCDQVAVIGLTPHYYHEFLEGLGNVRDRVKLHLRLTPRDGSNVTQNTSYFLDDPASRARFVASYLNAVRAGDEALREWHENGGGERPNPCVTCEYRQECHRAFGAISVPNVGDGDVGMYPLTPKALETFWGNLVDPDHKRSLKTPRGLLQNVVAPVLYDSDRIEAGSFPSSQIEHRNIQTAGKSGEVHDALMAVPESERARLQVAIAWWGDRNDGLIRKKNGRTLYSGIPAEVMTAFQLPTWGDKTITEPPGPDADVAPVGTQFPTKLDGAATADGAQTEQARPVPPRVESLSDDWKSGISNLDRWMDGANLADPSRWEALLRKAVGSHQSEALASPHWLWSKVLTKENVTLAGLKDRTTALTLELQRDLIVQRGLVAFAWLVHGQDLSPGSRSRRFADASAFAQWLGGHLAAHVKQIEDRLIAALGGHPQTLAAAVLILGALLHKNRPGRPKDLLDSWTRGANTLGFGPKNAANWDLLSMKIKDAEQPMRDLVFDWGRIGQRPQKSDSAYVAPDRNLSATRLVRTWLEGEWPETSGKLFGTFESKGSGLAVLKRLLDDIRALLPSCVDDEYKRVLSQTRAIDAKLGGADTEAFLQQADEQITKLAHIESFDMSHALLTKWKGDWKKLSDEGLLPDHPALRSLDTLARSFRETAADSRFDRLMMCLEVPQDHLAWVYAAVMSGAETVGVAFELAQQRMNAGTTEEASRVKSGADELVKLGEKLTKQLETAGERS